MSPKKKSGKKIVFVANYAFTLLNFRKNLISEFLVKGYSVYALCGEDSSSSALQELGVQLININFNGRKKNPITEAICLLKVFWNVRLIRPVAVFSFTIKANFYCGLVRYASKFQFFPNITGLGSYVVNERVLKKISNATYRLFLRNCTAVFVQNLDNLHYIKSLNICDDNDIILLPGSGVDLKRFKFQPYNFNGKPRKFYFISRVMKEKGVIEFFHAAQMFQKAGGSAEFYLVGNMLDEFRAEFEQKLKGAGVRYLGHISDIRPQLKDCDVVVLPSYYNEGTPKTLIEAAATGRAIITSDMPGCRDLVSNDNGYKVRAKDSYDLLEKFSLFASLTDMQVKEMGKNSRKLAETSYSEELVIKSYLKAFDISLNKVQDF